MLTVALAVAAGFLGAKVMASGAPVQTPLVYGATVTDAAGKPCATAVPVEVALYDAAAGGNLKCKAAAVQAEAGTGRFSVAMPADCVQAVHDTPDLWSETVVGAAKTALPRVHVAATPYALEADSAKTAGPAAVASGQLKATVDGLVATVAGLKGGGGGPVVIDGAGVVLGQFINLNRALQAVPAQYVTIVTNTGVILELQIDGSPNTSFYNVNFDGPSCTGNAVAPGAAEALWLAHFAVPMGSNGWYVTEASKSANKI